MKINEFIYDAIVGGSIEHMDDDSAVGLVQRGVEAISRRMIVTQLLAAEIGIEGDSVRDISEMDIIRAVELANMIIEAT